jgi:hypothetical protein
MLPVQLLKQQKKQSSVKIMSGFGVLGKDNFILTGRRVFEFFKHFIKNLCSVRSGNKEIFYIGIFDNKMRALLGYMQFTVCIAFLDKSGELIEYKSNIHRLRGQLLLKVNFNDIRRKEFFYHFLLFIGKKLYFPYISPLNKWNNFDETV